MVVPHPAHAVSSRVLRAGARSCKLVCVAHARACRVTSSAAAGADDEVAAAALEQVAVLSADDRDEALRKAREAEFDNFQVLLLLLLLLLLAGLQICLDVLMAEGCWSWPSALRMSCCCLQALVLVSELARAIRC